MKKLLIRRVSPADIYSYPPNTFLDVAIDGDGLISEVGESLPVGNDDQIIEAEGLTLSPGWVDLHTHCYWGATNLSVKPEDIGLKTGVTTLVDAGSAGEASFEGFRAFIARQNKEKIYAFLNLSSFGLTAVDLASEFAAGWQSFNLKRAQAAIEYYPNLICGVKVRCSGYIMHEMGTTLLRTAKKLAKVTGKPLMVHIGEAPPIPEDILNDLEAGDIVTHCCHGKAVTNLVADESILETAKNARSRGVLFDIGHGYASFSFKVAAELMAADFLPDTISSDLHRNSIKHFAYDLPAVMSKMLALGMSEANIIKAVTQTPRRFLNLNTSEKIILGDPADFTLYQIIDKEVIVQDAQGDALTLKRIFAPKYTLLNHHMMPCETYLQTHVPPMIRHENHF